MKKIISVIVVIAITLTLAACGENKKPATTEAETSVAKATRETKAEKVTQAKEETSANIQTEPETEVWEEPTEAYVEPKPAADSGAIRQDLMDFLDSYEAWVDEYCAFMREYKANPSDFTLLAKFASYTAAYAEMADKVDKWNDEDLTEAELLYFSEVTMRCTAKMMEVAY